jgi:hypothetical protein
VGHTQHGILNRLDNLSAVGNGHGADSKTE